jgi:hypothetical protein
MKSEDWGIIVGAIVAVGSVVGPWMWSINSKLERIARQGAILRAMAKALIRQGERLDRHDRRLDDHQLRLVDLEKSP